MMTKFKSPNRSEKGALIKGEHRCLDVIDYDYLYFLFVFIFINFNTNKKYFIIITAGITNAILFMYVRM